MERRNFLKILGVGTASGAIAPAVSYAKAFNGIPGTIEHARFEYLKSCYEGMDKEMYDHISKMLDEKSIARKVFSKNTILKSFVSRFLDRNEISDEISIRSNFPVRLSPDGRSVTIDRTKNLCADDFIGQENILLIKCLKAACSNDDSIVGIGKSYDISYNDADIMYSLNSACYILKQRGISPCTFVFVKDNLLIDDGFYSRLQTEYPNIEIINLEEQCPICTIFRGLPTPLTKREYKDSKFSTNNINIFVLGSPDEIGSLKMIKDIEITHPEAQHKQDVMWQIEGKININLNRNAIVRICDNTQVIKQGDNKSHVVEQVNKSLEKNRLLFYKTDNS